jgi:hypothetical protein
MTFKILKWWIWTLTADTLQHIVRQNFTSCFLLVLWPINWRQYFLSEYWWIFTELYGIASQVSVILNTFIYFSCTNTFLFRYLSPIWTLEFDSKFSQRKLRFEEKEYWIMFCLRWNVIGWISLDDICFTAIQAI